ncbi:exonuclease domain-containing protein [Cecembia rubra]|uniref:DNA polymerase-3 subunit epsilon n=1 Tax=Cecembia rubra TaxID=1485585 RepID=A0A2P8EDD6_9BACT|nr:exonuclease domain-containing protein [Cecembia rubra]PSL07463.1 DNA polymerase-3 subunit epsilon [Cecembia rubra]
MEFVIVDIETTGGNPNQGGITEIAAIVSDGHKVLDKFHTLINPQRFIPNFITGLTGINQEMVESAPTFGEIAEEFYDFLKGRVFVAHNVNFDYTFIREAFKVCGLDFNVPKLCTVRLSRKAFPGLGSYGLGRICEKLSITISARHRAFGDAEATELLFRRIYQYQSEIILQSLKKGNGESFLPPHITQERYQQIPEATGVYFFHDKNGQVIYVGKALNIKSRFKSHFSGNSREKILLKSEINDITWVLTGSEFLAYLLETLEIKRIWPKYNRALKYQSSNWALFQYEDSQGFIRFQVSKNNSKIQNLLEFDSHSEAWKYIMEQTEHFELCPKLTGIQKTAMECYDHQINKCLGACCGKEKVEVYNKRAQKFIDSIQSEKGSVLIKEKGRSVNETCALLFENGILAAYGFISQEEYLENNEEILNRLERVKHIPETKYILRAFLPKIHFRNIIPL